MNYIFNNIPTLILISFGLLSCISDNEKDKGQSFQIPSGVYFPDEASTLQVCVVGGDTTGYKVAHGWVQVDDTHVTHTINPILPDIYYDSNRIGRDTFNIRISRDSLYATTDGIEYEFAAKLRDVSTQGFTFYNQADYDPCYGPDLKVYHRE